MIDDLKTIMLFVLMAIASAYIRSRGFFQATIDAVLAFCMGYIVYLLLDYASLSGATRSGISCVVIMFSRALYDWINDFIRKKLTAYVMKRVGKNDRSNME